MPACHPLPHCWLFTDKRLADHGVVAARALPPGSGIVIRSDALRRRDRLQLIRRLRAIARARALWLLIADMAPAQAKQLAADGVHTRRRSAAVAAQAKRLGLISSAPVHDAAEARAVRRAGITIAFVSPLHATRSHEDIVPLGVKAWLRFARLAGAHPAALGGMTRARHRALLRRAAASRVRPGWAAIDAWEKSAAARRQKRNWVPT